MVDGAQSIRPAGWSRRAFAAELDAVRAALRLGSSSDERERYRLPSEAEWEYACRAGTTSPFSFGSTIATTQANYDGKQIYGEGVKGEYREATSPLGAFQANPFGLHDVHGNVSEWCEDVWHANYDGAPTEGSAWTTGADPTLHVVRGGSWWFGPRRLRSASRMRYDRAVRLCNLGFRVARFL